MGGPTLWPVIKLKLGSRPQIQISANRSRPIAETSSVCIKTEIGKNDALSQLITGRPTAAAASTAAAAASAASSNVVPFCGELHEGVDFTRGGRCSEPNCVLGMFT